MSMISKQEWLSTETPVVVFESMAFVAQANYILTATIAGADISGTVSTQRQVIVNDDASDDNTVTWRAPDGTTGISNTFEQDAIGLLVWTMSQPYQQGRWDLVLNRSGSISAASACIYWGVENTSLVKSTAILTNVGTPSPGHTLAGDASTALALLSNSVFFDTTTSKLLLYEAGGVVVSGHWLCYRTDGVTLATTLAQIAKRGPFVVGP